jgi:hypothetical protein
MAEIAYIDESYDDEIFVMSAFIVPMAHWRATFEEIKAHRQRLKALYGIFTSKELHALEFVSGRGRISERMIPKGLRAQLFRETMDMLAALPHVRVISGAWPLGWNGQEGNSREGILTDCGAAATPGRGVRQSHHQDGG